MKFKGNSIRSLAKVITTAGKFRQIRLAFDTQSAEPDSWKKIGFSDDLIVGESIIPSCIGKTSTFNARGKEIVRKDLDKIPRTYMQFRTWNDWHGYPHSGIQYRTIDVYPREHIAAPSETLYVLNNGDSKCIATREINLDRESEDDVLHLANLLLECFGGFDIIDATTGLKAGIKFRSLNWRILPKGEYPWKTAKPYVAAYTDRLDQAEKDVINYRMAKLSAYNPTFFATGTGGFDGYFVFGYPERNLYVLESAHLDNATYAFTDDWEEFSKLTKKDIICGVKHRRVIHDRKWNGNISTLLK